MQLASLPLHVNAVIKSSQELNESPGSSATAAPQYWLNALGWFFQYPGEHGFPGDGEGEGEGDGDGDGDGEGDGDGDGDGDGEGDGDGDGDGDGEGDGDAVCASTSGTIRVEPGPVHA